MRTIRRIVIEKQVTFFGWLNLQILREDLVGESRICLFGPFDENNDAELLELITKRCSKKHADTAWKEFIASTKPLKAVRR